MLLTGSLGNMNAALTLAVAVGLTSGCDQSELDKSAPPATSVEEGSLRSPPMTDATKPGTEAFIPADAAEATALGTQQVIDANNDFAIAMFHQMNSDEEAGNIVFSPYSLTSAMSLGYLGATGQTFSEIQQVFHLPSIDTLLPNTAALYNQINQPNADFDLTTSNALWVTKDLVPAPLYIEQVERYLGSQITTLDFASDPELARQTINQAIAKDTHNLIPNLLPKLSLNRSTEGVLTNAVYFKGDWVNKFQSEHTKPRPFHTFAASEQVLEPPVIDMMYQNDTFKYFEDNELQVIELPYQGQRLSMQIILPKSPDRQSLNTVTQALTTEKMNTWRSQSHYESIDLFLPKFKLNSRHGSLVEQLSAMGMTTAFSDQAEFSNLSQSVPLKIDTVLHQALVEVNETGTEAAAATAIIMAQAASAEEEVPERILFNINHPFVFSIYDSQSGVILFMGQLLTPPK